MTLLDLEETVSPGMPLQIYLYQLFLNLAFLSSFFFFQSCKITEIMWLGELWVEMEVKVEEERYRQSL